MARKSWWDGGFFPPSRPKKVDGGIKARSKRGGFGESWWAKRWIKVLEGFDIGSRLARGRSYARSGQVVEIAIAEGKVAAKVQGSRPKPYDVAIQVKMLSESEWSKVLDALKSQALFTAKLLAGEMPQDIEPIFEATGLSLFPTKLGDLTTKCSCPDWSNPCKHVAAVYYLLGEEFDRDPFLIFKLRGLEREALMARLEMPVRKQAPRGDPKVAPIQTRPREPLNVDMKAFWDEAARPADGPSEAVEAPREPAALPKRLGGFPFWRGKSPFFDAMEGIYAAASARGLEVILGTSAEGERPAAGSR